MTYRGLIMHLSEILGYHQIPFNPLARDIHNILGESPLHDDLTRQLLRAIYKKNRCSHLDSTVSREPTETVLIDIRQGALRAESTDIDKHGFLEDICFAVDSYFRRNDEDDPLVSVEDAVDTPSANIVDFARFRRIRKRA